MGITHLLEQWEAERNALLTARDYQVSLPAQDAARIAALGEMYRRSASEIIADLLRVALDELERGFPYVQGKRVIAEDEYGDPIYEDAGPASRFGALTRKHQKALQGEPGPDDQRDE